MVWNSIFPGKITSLDTSLLRASMKPGWEDLVRRCIQKFHLQTDGEMSPAKKHQQEGELLQTKKKLHFDLLEDSFTFRKLKSYHCDNKV